MSERSRREVVLIIQCAAILLGTALGFATMLIRQVGIDSRPSIAVVVALPVMTSLLFVLSAFLAPGMVATRRLVFPLNLTLPIVYAALLLMTVTLFTRTGSAIFQIPETLRVAHLWARPPVLILLALAQCATLTIVGAMKRSDSAK